VGGGADGSRAKQQRHFSALYEWTALKWRRFRREIASLVIAQWADPLGTDIPIRTAIIILCQIFFLAYSAILFHIKNGLPQYDICSWKLKSFSP
jgi:hypothetical protein